MKCPECRNPVEKEAQFCPKCFARLERPGLWQRFLSLFRTLSQPPRLVVEITKNVTIKTTDKDGQRHEYHSLEEAPPELRAEIQKAEAEALKEALSSKSLDGAPLRITRTKTISTFRVKDPAGNERVYHSLEELPPEVRAAFEQAQQRATE